MSSLYLVEQGTSLQKEKGRFIVMPPDDDKLEIPVREVERVLIFGSVQVSTAAMAVCLQKKIPVIFLTQLGDYKGHLWSAELEDLEAERQQFLSYGNPELQVPVARAIVRGKLMNCRQLLLRLNRKRKLPSVAEAIKELKRYLVRLERAETLDQIRGYEGVAAARYFPAFGQLVVNPAFQFAKRDRRPPRDPVNSMLSFGYTLLFNTAMGLILAEGLNPYLGNLHYSTKQLPGLALDLMEEFRSPVVDSLVLGLVNRKTIRPTDFTWPAETGGVYLTGSARRVFIQKFEVAMGQMVGHPDVQEPVSYRRAIHLQVRRYKQGLLAGVAYEPFLRAV